MPTRTELAACIIVDTVNLMSLRQIIKDSPQEHASRNELPVQFAQISRRFAVI
jgi:hypothetical protein